MKKQFLLSLMAMLLPLAAWADDISTANVSFASATYKGTETKAPQETVTLNGSPLTKESDYTVAYFSDEDCTTSVEVKNAGTYWAKISGAGSNTGDVKKSFIIKKASLTLLVGNTEKEYGDPDDLQVVYSYFSGIQPGDDEEEVMDAIRDDVKVSRMNGQTGESVGSYQITLVGGTHQNYDIIFTSNGALNILPAKLKVSVAEGKTLGKTYGDEEPAFSELLTVEGWKFNDAEGNYLTLSRKDGSDAGDYDLTYTLDPKVSGNYNVVLPENKFVISKAQMTLTATKAEKTYGEENPAFTATASSYKNGDDATKIGLTVTRTSEEENAKTYTEDLVPSATSQNYEYTIVKADFTINPKDISAEDVIIAEIKDQTYTGTDIHPTLTITYGDKTLEMGEDKDYTVEYAEESKDVAENVAITVKAVKEDGNYTGQTKTTFNIVKAPLTVTANNRYYSYEQTNRTYTVTYNGFVNDEKAEDVLEGELTYDVTQKLTSDDQGYNNYYFEQYYIKPSGLTAKNYDIKYENGILFIKNVALVIKADDAQKTYGANDPNFTYKVYATGTDGSKTTEIENASMIESVTLTRAEGINVGTYDITPSDAVINVGYTVKYETGTLTINKATVTIKAKDAQKARGTRDPEKFEYDIEGLQYDDQLTTEPTLTRTAGEAVGTYNITASGAAFSEDLADNYDIEYVNGTFTITKPTVIIYIDEDQQKEYGEEDPTLTYTISGLLGDDELTAEPTLTRADGETVGTYLITATGAESEKYDILYGTEKVYFTITKADLAITAKAQEIEFGENADLTASATTVELQGTKNNEENKIYAAITLSLSEAAATGKVDIYKDGIVITVPETPAQDNVLYNYNITTDTGTLTITGEENITLDGSADEIESLLAGYDGQTVNVTITNLRNYVGDLTKPYEVNNVIEAEKWYTLVLPFEVSVRDLSAELGYAIINVPNTENNESNKVKFQLTMQTVPANTLMAFKVDRTMTWTDEVTLKFTGKTIVAPSAESIVKDQANNEFVGVYKKTIIDADNELFMWPYGGGYYTASAVKGYNQKGLEVYPLNGYFRTESANARIYMEELDGSVTAINAVTGDVINTTAEGWYTVGGVKLNGEPTQKGIYINNGKKVVIK